MVKLLLHFFIYLAPLMPHVSLHGFLIHFPIENCKTRGGNGLRGKARGVLRELSHLTKPNQKKRKSARRNRKQFSKGVLISQMTPQNSSHPTHLISSKGIYRIIYRMTSGAHNLSHLIYRMRIPSWFLFFPYSDRHH